MLQPTPWKPTSTTSPVTMTGVIRSPPVSSSTVAHLSGSIDRSISTKETSSSSNSDFRASEYVQSGCVYSVIVSAKPVPPIEVVPLSQMLPHSKRFRCLWQNLGIWQDDVTFDFDEDLTRHNRKRVLTVSHDLPKYSHSPGRSDPTTNLGDPARGAQFRWRAGRWVASQSTRRVAAPARPERGELGRRLAARDTPGLSGRNSGVGRASGLFGELLGRRHGIVQRVRGFD